ncbi:hypothetical protein ALSL_0254 [Aerosticca soli]|uniref:Uncharacterized protein n=1 Tax=Aerosticca soli TaxID=2010829 RepID=A0A2Z6E1P5_9GAMM|nr:hypothetical protein ALSL_0254 [Aerosticca soli]
MILFHAANGRGSVRPSRKATLSPSGKFCFHRLEADSQGCGQDGRAVRQFHRA